MIETKQYLVNNECYIQGRKLTECRGVLIHSTATPGANVNNFVTSWNKFRPNNSQVCVHAFCDDKHVVNTLPYDMRCWGCGGSGNNYYIQIEMCEPSGIYFTDGWRYNIKDGCEQLVKEYIKAEIDNVIKWTVDRLVENNISVVNEYTVTSHYEAHKLGMASNHGDPSGLLSLVGLTMDDIRDRVRVELEHRLKNNSTVDVDRDNDFKAGDLVKLKDGALQFNGNTISKNYVDKLYKIKSINNKNNRVVLTIDGVVIYAVNIKDIVKYKVDNKDNINETSYKIKVTVDALNIRSGPGTSFEISGCIRDRGVYTIVETDRSGNWGKLKSGIGWIHLSYTYKI